MIRNGLILLSLMFTLTSYGHFDSEDNKGLFSYKGGYLIGRIGNELIDYDKTTHIIVAGSAKKKESNQFFQSALSRGYKYLEIFPGQQVVIISSPEVVKKKNEEVFKEFNIDVQKSVKKVPLTGSVLAKEMLLFSSIASFDFYGHSSPWSLIIGKRHTTLNPSVSSKLIESLDSHFTPLASASLNGCNGGLTLAPALSKMWKIPVSGALSGSLFERIQNNGLWLNEYVGDDTLWTTENTLSYVSGRSCSSGACWRMKPSSSAYSGYWGQFTHGLGYYKFFCNYKDSQNRCKRASALSLLSFPSINAVHQSSSIGEFKEVLYDYLCPTGRGVDRFYECIKGIKDAIETGNHSYQPFNSVALSCNLKKCEARIVCKQKKSGPKPGSCKLVPTTQQISTTFIDEYIMLLEGFQSL